MRSTKEIYDILGSHSLWLETCGTQGARADLSEEDLRHVDFGPYDLTEAILRGTNLSGVNLMYKNLARADFRRADLSNADLSSSYLGNADLSDTTLIGARLYNAYFFKTCLEGANLYGADLREATFTGALFRSTYGIATFSAGQHTAILYKFEGEKRLSIGCKDYLLSDWIKDYQEIGMSNNYTFREITNYEVLIRAMKDIEL